MNAILYLPSDSPANATKPRQSRGFRGRTSKEADACYKFWRGGPIQLPFPDALSCSRLPFTNSRSDTRYNRACGYDRFHFVPKKLKLGDFAMAPGERAGEVLHRPLESMLRGLSPDQYQTRPFLAAIATFPPPEPVEVGAWVTESLDPSVPWSLRNRRLRDGLRIIDCRNLYEECL